MKTKNNFKVFIYIFILLYIGLSYYGEKVNIDIENTLRARQIKVVRQATKTRHFYLKEVMTTAYSEYDSCHTGSTCLMANGERAHVGGVACNFLPLGTEIDIAGEIYIVKDRHAKWLKPRIDLFLGYGQEAYNKAINYGKQIKTIKVLDK